MLIAAGFPLRWNLRTSGIPALGPFPQLHMSKMRVFRPIEVRGTYQYLSLDMVRSTRRISMLTPSAGHHWWYGDFATGMASACPPAVSAILRVPDDPPRAASTLRRKGGCIRIDARTSEERAIRQQVHAESTYISVSHEGSIGDYLLST